MNGVERELSHLATKTELAEKLGKVWLVTAIGVLLVTYAAGRAGITALSVVAMVE